MEPLEITEASIPAIRHTAGRLRSTDRVAPTLKRDWHLDVPNRQTNADGSETAYDLDRLFREGEPLLASLEAIGRTSFDIGRERFEAVRAGPPLREIYERLLALGVTIGLSHEPQHGEPSRIIVGMGQRSRPDGAPQHHHAISRCAQTLLRCGSSPDCVTITTAPQYAGTWGRSSEGSRGLPKRGSPRRGRERPPPCVPRTHRIDARHHGKTLATRSATSVLPSETLARDPVDPGPTHRHAESVSVLSRFGGTATLAAPRIRTKHNTQGRRGSGARGSATPPPGRGASGAAPRCPCA